MEPLTVIGSTFGGRLVAPDHMKDLRERDAELQVLLARLEDLRSHCRLPGVNIICSCREMPGSRRQTRSFNDDDDASENDSSSEEEDDEEEGFSLGQVMKAIDLYERQPVGRRSPKTLRNLVCCYSGQHNIEDEQVVKVLGLMEITDHGLGEAAVLLARQLCQRESNAFKFLYHDAMKHILTLLERTSLQHLHEVAAQVIAKLAGHHALADLWIDHMMTTGLTVLLTRMSPDNTLAVRYACARALSALATHPNLAVLLTDQAMEVVTSLKDINTDFKEVYAEILTVLVQHTDHTRTSVLDVDALPAALTMLRQGPCGSQKQALVLLATLAQSDCGLKVILESDVVQYVMSAFVDSECRHVRCGATEALESLLETDNVSFQKQILVCIDKFFHDHEEGFESYWGKKKDGTTGSKYRTDTAMRATRATEHLAELVVKHIHKEARLQTNQKGHVTEIHLAPGIDRDATCLRTLTLLTKILHQLGHLRVNPFRVPNFDISGAKGAELRMILRRSTNGTNPSTLRMLVDGGALCLVDLLHAYTIKLDTNGSSFPFVPPGGGVKDKTDAATVQSSSTDVLSMFDENEVMLIRALLEFSQMFARGSCNNCFRNIQKEVQDKMEDYKNNTNSDCSKETSKRAWGEDISCENKSGMSRDIEDRCQCGRECRVTQVYKSWINTDHVRPPTVGNSSSLDCSCSCRERFQRKYVGNSKNRVLTNDQEKSLEGNMKRDDDLEYSKAGVLFLEELNKQLSSTRRWLRIKLYNSGLVESVGSWLASEDPVFKALVLEVLRCLVQPGAEVIKPHPATVQRANNDNKSQNRPPSAMTSKEREKALNIALYQMSSTVKTLITDALGKIPEGQREFKDGELSKHDSPGNKTEFLGDHNNGDTSEGMVVRKQLTYHADDKFGHPSHDNGQGDGAKHRAICGAGTQNGIRKSASENMLISVKRSKSRTELRTYNHEDYNKFARKPLRPQSAKPPQVRPFSAKVAVSKTVRPQSARVFITRPQSAKVKDAQTLGRTASVSKAVSEQCLVRKQKENTTGLQRANSAKCLKTGSPNLNRPCSAKGMPRLPSENSPSKDSRLLPRTGSESGRPQSGKPFQVFRSRPSSGTSVGFRPQSGKVILTSRSQGSSEKSAKALQEVTRRMMREGMFPWKPSFDANETLQSQTCMRVVEVCARHLVADILSRTATVRHDTIVFLEELVHRSHTEVHMKLSQYGLMPRLVDFLRINEESELVEVIGLLVARLLVTSDRRLKELFAHHGGTELLMGMASYSHGFLRSEVAATLKTVTRTDQQVLPTPGGAKSPGQAPDVWDKILQRWQEEDRLMLMLKKKSQ